MFRGIRLVPDTTTIDFIGKRMIAMALSGLLILACLVSLVTQGLNFGIDFAGGLLIEARTEQQADLSDMRQRLNALGLGDVAITGIGDTGRDVMIRVPKQPGEEEAQMAALNAVKAELGTGVEFRRTEVVGPKVGEELVRDGALAVGLAILVISAYIWIRFEWQFGVGALVATIHDVIATLGIYSLFQIDFDLTTVAALLTIAGYSINDTVVNYDRVRENLRRYKTTTLADLINISLNQVLSRTILTSGTTLVAVLAILFFGGPVLRGFAIGLTWGIVIGTFSSIYVAMPLLLYTGVRRESEEDPFTEGEQQQPDAGGKAKG
ncbi:protein translocase subunit SecF [Caenispirillum bisanense]|uniref:Protein-export membrane protein SecF n=1 Tax=Caenispirillum bisanense TaxID=414052 RepID=A0A286GEP3_9PROT|nr:protein translocase subunit SecF [Caenispirillum bisanense]SOD93987.1 protein translocase subunit secF [Caenispirillum bisanense]